MTQPLTIDQFLIPNTWLITYVINCSKPNKPCSDSQQSANWSLVQKKGRSTGKVVPIHVTKAYWGSRGTTPLILDGCESSASRPGRFTLGVHWIRGCLDTTASLEGLWRKQHLFPCRGSKPRPSLCQLHYPGSWTLKYACNLGNSRPHFSRRRAWEISVFNKHQTWVRPRRKTNNLGLLTDTTSFSLSQSCILFTYLDPYFELRITCHATH